MVKITNVSQRISEKGPFVLLELSGDLEMIQSQNTGRFYATVRKCSVSTTVDLETAKGFIGKQMPGAIVRVLVDPYEFTIPDTGEVIKLAHRYDYVPDQKMLADYETRWSVSQNLYRYILTDYLVRAVSTALTFQPTV